MAIRYRVGMDEATGRLLVGWAHCAQSVQKIVKTMIGERLMRLTLGSDLVSHLGDNLVVSTVLAIYRDAVTDIHAQEPEYRVRRVQLVKLTRTGSLHLATFGDYYPEGRLGNYDLVEPKNGSFALVAGEAGGTRSAA